MAADWHEDETLQRRLGAPETLESDVLDLSRYLNGLRRRWLFLVVSVVLAGFFALIRYSLTPKEYSATTTIQIERKRLSLLALGQAGWLEDWWNQVVRWWRPIPELLPLKCWELLLSLRMNPPGRFMLNGL